MDNEITLYREVPHTCPYLADRVCSNLRFSVESADPELVEHLIESGYRHFSERFFYPSCPDCNSCIGVRVLVSQFKPNRSQKRCLTKNQDLQISIGPVQIDEERLSLLNSFQVDRFIKKDWGLLEYDEEQYWSCFAWNSDSAMEIVVRNALGKILAIGIVDITPNCLSAGYHFHDPAEAHRGLGNWLILKEIEYLQQCQKEYLYLGLWNADVPSLRYKVNFKPIEYHIHREWLTQAKFYEFNLRNATKF